MEFSFCALPAQSMAEVVAMVRRAEDAGIPMVWIPDETFMRDPYVLLGAIAASTGSIRLGVGIANPYTRHPMQIARAVATVAELCPQRLVLGIGAGLKPTRKALGCPEGDFTEVTRDAIVAMKALFAGERVTMSNNVFTFDDAHLEFPVSAPIDIYVATTHPRAFRMAGEVADGAIIGNVGKPEAMRQIVSWIGEGAVAAGRDPSVVRAVAWNFALCGDESGPLYDTIRTIAARTIANSHSAVSHLLGVDKETVERIRSVVRGPDPLVPSDLVTDAMIDHLALVGTAVDCAARVRALEAAGAAIFGVRPSLEVVEELDYEGMIHSLWSQLKAT